MVRKVLPGVVLALVVGCAGGSGVADGENAKAVIDKAIKAQGGAEKLSQFKAGRFKARGTLTMRGQELPLTLETVYQLPDKYKTVMQFDVQGNKIVVTQVLDGDKGWMSGPGKTLDLEGKLLNAFKEEFYAANVEMLVPLLKEKGYTLSGLKEIQVSGKPAVGVKVAAKGHRDIELYFDKGSSLPVKTIRTTFDAETMKEATAEVLYSDAKEFDGITSPTKMVVNQDGKKLMELKLIEFKKLDKLDPKEFTRPK
jgi:hypothetical protein